MPPTPFTAGLTPEEKVVYQRERNKIKQQNLRARRAAAKEAERNNSNKSRSASSSSSRGGGGKTSALPSTQAQKTMEQLKKKEQKKKEQDEEDQMVDTSVVARMAKRLAELGEGEEEIVKLVEGGREGGPSNGNKRARMDPTSFSDFIASPSSSSGGVSTPASTSSSSSSSASSSSSKRLTSFNLFAALLNGSLPPPKPLHLLTSHPTDSRALPIILHPDFNQSALSFSSLSSSPRPPFHLPARELPSYSYASPVDLDIGRYPLMNPLQSVDWKVRLFQLHSAMHKERMHPTEGYLVNPALQETVAKAQLLILQLLGACSNQKVRFDARRVLSIEDQNYLDYAPMDPRMEWLPDPLVRVHTARTAGRGGVNLTEMMGMGIETATLYGDSWDFGAWTMDHHTHVPYIPDCSISPIGLKCQGGGPNHPPHRSGELGGGFGMHVGLLGNHLGLKGSTIREIVLGLEVPNSRTREPVFTSVPEGLWEHLPYDEGNPMHEIAWRAGGAAEVHAAIIQNWCDEEAKKGKLGKEESRVRT